MPMVTLHKVGEGNLYHMHVLDPHDPGFGVGRPDRPDQGLPGGGLHPGNRPPGSGGGYPSHGLPGAPGDTLPVQPPPNLLPGYTLVMVRGPHGNWEYAFIAPGDPPPKPLPPGSIEHPGNRPPGSGMPPRPDQGLPGSPGHPSQGLPPSPGTPSNPIAPTPAPKPA